MVTVRDPKIQDLLYEIIVFGKGAAVGPKKITPWFGRAGGPPKQGFTHLATMLIDIPHSLEAVSGIDSAIDVPYSLQAVSDVRWKGVLNLLSLWGP